jgi:hypothetical protein
LIFNEEYRRLKQSKFLNAITCALLKNANYIPATFETAELLFYQLVFTAIPVKIEIFSFLILSVNAVVHL